MSNADEDKVKGKEEAGDEDDDAETMEVLKKVRDTLPNRRKMEPGDEISSKEQEINLSVSSKLSMIKRFKIHQFKGGKNILRRSLE
ncbi:hypothetical protein RCL_jg21958.t1 [Rhizophagus clarus]|uniref:Uncharacterized protein n=1 Tax=Rhizophagus clarus TaxID=94130 RepID=A0A8H3MGB2_9GLOM|nr:hypothetical protein RCL_jg21958.t1 [Rhizophagus clarus]